MEFEKISQQFGFNVLESPFTTDSGANIKCALKNGLWQPCFDHRLHTVISCAWNKTLEDDLEIKLTYEKMMKVRAYFKQSSDKESCLQTKLLSDNTTRPWCGLANFFSAYLSSFDGIEQIIPERIDAPSNKSLIKKISEAFTGLTPIFKAMEAANVPTLHLVIVSFVEIMRKIEKWPLKLENLKMNVKQCNF